MATNTNFTIRKGRTGTIILTVTGVSSWTDLKAKLIASKTNGGIINISLTGVIDAENNIITFTYTHDTTKGLAVYNYYYEIVLYKEDKTYLKSINYGLIYIEDVVKIDPVS